MINLDPRLYFAMRRLKKSGDGRTIDYNFDLIGRYFYNTHLEESGEIYEINDDVSEDIDIDRVFQKIDCTTSPIGRQYLYARIRTVDHDLAKLAEFSSHVDYFRNHPSEKEEVKKRLRPLSSNDGYYFQELFQGEITKPRNLTSAYVSSLLFIVFLVAGLFDPIFLTGLFPVLIYNIFLFLQNKKNMNYYYWNTNELKKTINTVHSLTSSGEVRERFDGYRQFLPALLKLKKKSGLFSGDKQQANDIAMIVTYITDLVKISLNLEIILFTHFIKELISNRDNLKKLFEYVGYLDSVVSVSDLHEDYALCQPVFWPGKKIRVEGLVHPLVDNCVANSIELSGKSLLLTGSNMSGKTTFIRAFAVNAILAQTIGCCFAREYRAPQLNIFTSIRISDSVEESTSYFFKELLVIKEFLDNVDSPRPCLFIMDEIFKGTNTLERISAGYSILAYLNSGDHFVFASTHDVELADLLEKEGYALYHTCETIAEGKLVFDYKLKNGKLATRNALKILALYDFPQEVIEKALQTEATLLEGKPADTP